MCVSVEAKPRHVQGNGSRLKAVLYGMYFISPLLIYGDISTRVYSTIAFITCGYLTYRIM